MKQQDIFDQALNDSLDRLFKGETIDRILSDNPELAGELEPLLRTAAAGRAYSRIQPRADFKARARYEFMSAVRELENQPHRRFAFKWRWQSPLAIALTAVAVMVIAGGGVVLASGSSLPGDALYSVKLTTEKVQLAVTFSDVTKTELNAKYASRRTAEIEKLAAGGSSEQVQMAAANLSRNLNNMSTISLGDYPVSEAGVPAPANSVLFDTETAGVNDDVNVMSAPSGGLGVTGGAPSDSPPVALSAARSASKEAVIPDETAPVTAPEGDNTVSTGAEVTDTAAADVAPQLAPAPQSLKGVSPAGSENNGYSPSSNSELSAGSEILSSTEVTDVTGSDREMTEIERIRQIIEQNYWERQASLQAALEKARPELRPVIKQALAESEFEYWKAIQNLDLNTSRE